MNAYETLGIEKLLDSKKAERNPITSDALIRVKAKKLLDECVFEMNQIVSEEATSISEKLRKIQEKLKDMIKYVTAYDSIADAKSRAKYSKMEEKDIKELVGRVEKAFDRVLLGYGKTENAFNVLGISSEEQQKRDDEYFRNKMYQTVTISLADSRLSDIQSMENFVFDLTKYFWAYSNIAEAEKREEYKYISLAEKGDRIAKSMGTPEIAELQAKKNCVIDFPVDEKYSRILVSQMVALKSKELMLSETKGYGYGVQKIAETGERTFKVVFSNINMDRMNSDVKYRTLVQEQLLSDEAIALADLYLGSYVGYIPYDSQQVSFNPECVGMCRKLKRREQKRENNGDTSNKNVNTDNPDTDDSGDR